jgi:hypothetical protein
MLESMTIGEIRGTDGPEAYDSQIKSTSRKPGRGTVIVAWPLVYVSFGSECRTEGGYLSPAQSRAFAYMLLSAADMAEDDKGRQ